MECWSTGLIKVSFKEPSTSNPAPIGGIVLYPVGRAHPTWL